MATKYIPLKKNRPPNSYFSQAKACAEAARQNYLLNRQLLESNQAAALSILDYHYAFTSAIVLQLARLVPDTNMMDDSEKISSLWNYLDKSGDKGNESARDCARMVTEFGAVVERLLTNQEIRMTNGMSSNVEMDTAVGQISERMAYLSGQGILSTSDGSVSSGADFLDMDLPVNQSEAYQQVFSWFQDTIF